MTKEIRDSLTVKQAITDNVLIEIQQNCAVRERDKVNLIQDLRRTEALAEVTSDIVPEGLADKLKGHTAKLYEHDALLRGLDRVNKGLLWIGRALALSIIGLIWALITGQASIVFGS